MDKEQIKRKVISKLETTVTFDTPIYVITFNDRRLKLGSGKSSWSFITAAKNALRNHLPYIATYREQLPAVKELEDEGVIKYVQL